MVPLKQGTYTFRRQSIPELRQRLGMSQAQMAEQLGVPKNTVSRWEREKDGTTPDADYLAAIYSLGKEKGIAVEFFAPRKQKAAPAKKAPAPAADYIIVYWDIVTITPLNSYDVSTQTWAEQRVDQFIRSEAQRRVPKATRRLFKAFSHLEHSAMTDRLAGWRIWEDNVDWTRQFGMDILSDASADPHRTTVFLVTQNTEYVSVIHELRGRGARVYLMAPSDVSQELVTAVGQKRWIKLQ